MDLSFYGIGSMNAHQRNHNTNVEQPNATAFGELMATVGTQFRFQQDPNQTVYTVTNAKVSGQDGTSEIFNYETSHGGWGVDDGNGVSNCVGGGGLGSNTCPPWGSKNPSTNSIAGKSAFFSDLFSSSREKMVALLIIIEQE